MPHAFTTLFPFFQVFLTTKFIFPRQTAFRPKTGIQTSPAGGTKRFTPLKSVPNRQTRRFGHVCRGTVPASVVFPAAGTAAFARTQQTSPETRDFKTAANFAVRHKTVLPRRQSIQPRTNPGFVRPAPGPKLRKPYGGIGKPAPAANADVHHKKRNGLPDVPFQFLLFRLKPSWYQAAPCNKRAAPDFPSARASGWLWPDRHWYRSQNAWRRTKRRSASCRVPPPVRPRRPD